MSDVFHPRPPAQVKEVYLVHLLQNLEALGVRSVMVFAGTCKVGGWVGGVVVILCVAWLRRAPATHPKPPRSLHQPRPPHTRACTHPYAHPSARSAAGLPPAVAAAGGAGDPRRRAALSPGAAPAPGSLGQIQGRGGACPARHRRGLSRCVYAFSVCRALPGCLLDGQTLQHGDHEERIESFPMHRKRKRCFF